MKQTKKEMSAGMRTRSTKPWLLSDGYAQRQIDVEAIVYAQADGMYSMLVITRHISRVNARGEIIATDDKEVISLSSPLCAIESVLPEEIFVRVSRSYVINIWKIKAIHGNTLSMSTGEYIHIGETYRHALDGRFNIIKIRRSEESSGGSERKPQNEEKTR